MPASELSPSIVPAACDPLRHLWQGNEADHGSATLKDTTYTYEGGRSPARNRYDRCVRPPQRAAYGTMLSCN